MASSDDEADAGPRSVSNYYFVDDEDAPTSFSVLPFDWSESESVKEVEKQQIFLQGSVDNGLQTIHKEVKAWKFDLLNEIPLISVLTKENNWIKLEKPRKSFEEIIRTVLITVHCLHFTRRNPEASGKSVWDHLCRVFRFSFRCVSRFLYLLFVFSVQIVTHISKSIAYTRLDLL